MGFKVYVTQTMKIAAVAMVAVYSLFVGHANAASFDPAINFRSGDGVLSMVTADFNKDGLLDFATANRGADTVSVHLNQGGGVFAEPWAEYHVGPFAPLNDIDDKPKALPYAVTAGDFNGDGWLDLTVANSEADTISVLLNSGPDVPGGSTGPGTFDAAVDFSVRTDGLSPTPDNVVRPIEPSAVITADFNGDGSLDIATANTRGANISVLLGNGTGTFGPAANYWAGAQPVSLIAGHFNADVCIDVAVALSGSTQVQIPGMPAGTTEPHYHASVLLNNCDGLGTFADYVQYRVGLNPAQIITEDLNGDNILDLVIANFSVTLSTPARSWVSVLHGIGNGTFGEEIQVDTDQFPASVAAADLDNDGNSDLVSAQMYTPGSVGVMTNDTFGGFAPVETFSPGASNGPNYVITGDFDSDGDNDVIVSGRNADEFALLKNQFIANSLPPGPGTDPLPPGPGTEPVPPGGGDPVLTPAIGKIRWKEDKGEYSLEFLATVTNTGDSAAQGFILFEAALGGASITVDPSSIVGLAVGRSVTLKAKVDFANPVEGQDLVITVHHAQSTTDSATVE